MVESSPFVKKMTLHANSVEIVVYFFAASTTFGDVVVLLFVAGGSGSEFGEIVVRSINTCNTVVAFFRGPHHISTLASCHNITIHHLLLHHIPAYTSSHHITWPFTSPPPMHYGNTTSHHQTERPSHRLVALPAFYRQILSLAYSFFSFWNFRPRLARLYLYDNFGWPLSWLKMTPLGTAFCPSTICALQNTMVTPPRPVPKAPNHWLLACAECEACEERVPGCRAWSPNLSNLRERENRKNRKQERERLYGYTLCVGGLCECLKVYPT